MPNNQTEHAIFEEEVRHVARSLWPAALHGGSEMLDGREFDGIFETEDCTHIVEATVSRTKEKAEHDAAKMMAQARKTPGTAGRVVQCWLVTKYDPTADQRTAAIKLGNKAGFKLNVLSYRQFQSRIVDTQSYLSLRANHYFGSIRDPETGGDVPASEYVPIELLALNGGRHWAVDDVADGLLRGERLVLQGDYGAGKSMTLRAIYLALRARHLKGDSTKFPVYINLREHIGQSDALEVLERHGRLIGFPHPSHLVRAWKAGEALLLLDGFDELGALGVQGPWRKLKDNRYRATQAVRAFARESLPGTGLATSGRAHYFDNETECRSALGLGAAHIVSLNDFNEQQLRDYLSRKKCKPDVPPWLPMRPLLVGYLVARRLIGQGEARLPDDPATGWNKLLDRICDREAEIEAGVDGTTVRKILERVASLARTGADGLGPLTAEQLRVAFEDVCQYPPDERSLVLLMRLPGLGPDSAAPQNRKFVDLDFADACRAGDVVDWVKNLYVSDGHEFNAAEAALGTLGLDVAADRLRDVSANLLGAAIVRAEKSLPAILVADLARLALALRLPLESSTVVRDVVIQSLDLESGVNGRSLRFQSCYIENLILDPDLVADDMPRFEGCLVVRIEGRVSPTDLPAGVFDADCEFQAFADEITTTSSILQLRQLSLGTRVLLTVLKKLFLQRGSGRKESAVVRGLDLPARRLVKDVLRALETEGFAYASRRGADTIWIPNRLQLGRAKALLASPTETRDPLVDRVASLE
jgi:hypothetical protein